MGEWVRTNYFGQFGEKRISAYTSKEDCINKVREECQGYDLANVHINGEDNSCWCQSSNANSVAENKNKYSYYDTCRVRPYKNLDGCIGDWVSTSVFSDGEDELVGEVTSRAECVELVKTKCGPEFDLAHTQEAESTMCFCQKSKGVHLSPSPSDWITCRAKPRSES